MSLTPARYKKIRRGLSLVEIMIALVMTLIILGAMMSAFSFGSAEMQKGRAAIELTNRLITAEEQLRRDLDRITVELKPHHKIPGLPKGYVEIVDGPATDYVIQNDPTERPGLGLADFGHGGNQLVFGDRDDFFACTIKSDGKAFRGRFLNQVVESHFAEVAWFTVFDNSTADPDDVLLVRRQLLILPSLTIPAGVTYNDFISENDISIGRDATGNLFANRLTDLAFRGNRFSHRGSLPVGGTPDPNRNPKDSLLEIFQLGNRFNETHVFASSVAAFDVQVFAPDASNLVLPDATASELGEIAEPNDIAVQKGLFPAANFALLNGAFVDLGKGTGLLGGVSNGYRFGYNVSAEPPFVRYPPLAGDLIYETYDTGTSQYNRRIANHPGGNGVDDDIDGVIDEPSEVNGNYESIGAPYNAPIRGLKFSMRVWEPVTKQVRQISVTKSFVAE